MEIRSQQWLFLDSGAGDFAFNMALDEALLEAMPRISKPILRFYSWKERAASFGYFQKYAEIEPLTLLRPLVRRPTGGGLVPHDRDWTYSLIFPTCHEWYSLTATESYQRVHEWIRRALEKLNLPSELAADRQKAGPGACFVGHEKFDLLWQGQKIAGAAQRRRRWGLLIQGSVQPPSVSLDRSQWQNAMGQVASDWVAQWSKFEPDQALVRQAIEMATQKYSQSSYNKKR